MAVIVIYGVSSTQKQPLDDLWCRLCGVVFCFLPRLALQRCPKDCHDISANSLENAPNRPKSLKTTKKAQLFHKKRKSPHVHASTREKAVFFG